MLLNTIAFFLFFCILLSAYYILPKFLQKYILAVANIYYFALAGVRSFIYISAVTLVTFLFALLFDRPNKQQSVLKKMQDNVITTKEKMSNRKMSAKKKRNFFLLLLVVLLSPFVFLKFCPMFPGSRFSVLTIPLGMSFYILKAIGYCVEVYRGNEKAENSFLSYATFIFYFPTILQGPICRYSDMGKQFATPHSFDYDTVKLGAQRFVWGLLKKLLIANGLAHYVDYVFQNVSALFGVEVALGVMLYLVQLYADFSGYMDMAIGVSQMLDIDLPENFNRPFTSKSVPEFWQRWHMTLGFWFRDYVLYPFVMSPPSRTLRKKTAGLLGKKLSNALPALCGTLLVWLLTGLWHGVSVTYLLWGAYFGVLVAGSMFIDAIAGKIKFRQTNFFIDAFRVVRTFVLVSVGAFFLRAPSLDTIESGFAIMIRNPGFSTLATPLQTFFDAGMKKGQLIILAAGVLIMLLSGIISHKKSARTILNNLPILVRWSIYVSIVYCIILCASYMGGSEPTYFMYMHF